ncbi:MAG: hypothetical protein PHG82_04165 [Candidatus Gracilibacteria bacterium]|nr:hypothetical protein [Candidatus Gracilibacteria bacterium]
MTTKVLKHLNGEGISEEVVDRLISENLENKLDHYLAKFDSKEDAESTFEIFLKTNKKGLFDGKLLVKIDGVLHPFSREDYKKLDDLVNHLFDHLKEELAKK